jgi:SAM-dependent methyltransferase
MGIGYTLAYQFGITPWEQAGSAGQEQLDALFDREQDGALEHAPALDLGCGRGTHAIQLAARGWDVTGVDLVPKAVDDARQAAATAGQNVRFIVGDVTAMPEAVGTGYRFLLDIGCFHGLKDEQRIRYGRQLDAVSAPGATALLLAFAGGGHGPLPRGADTTDLAKALPHWSLLDQCPADTSGMPRPLRARAPQFYRLRKN